MNYDNYYKNGGMTKEESVSAIALRIGARKEAVAKFVEKNNIDTNKLNSDLKSGQVYFLDVITAIVGKPNNKYEKEIVKKYGNKMAMGGKTQGYDDREDERLAMDYGKISGKDFDGSHDMREHSRRDDARFEERMEKGGKLYYTMNNVGKSKYTIHSNDGEKTHKDGSPFYDIAIFSNRKDFERAEKKLQSEGYKYRYEDGGETERKAEAIKTAVEIATMAYKNGVRAYDMDFEDFSERIFYISKTSYPIVDLRLAYNALLNSGYKNGGQIDEDELHELARLVMKSIDYTVNISLDEFIDGVSMTGYQRELCQYVLKMFDSHEFAKGGAIENQYEGRTPQDIWDSLDSDQRYHFIDDHALQIEMLQDENYDYNSNEFPKSINIDLITKSMQSDWKDLDETIQNRFANHVRQGEYAKGGIIKVGDKVRSTTFKGVEGEVIRKKGDMLFIRKPDLSDKGNYQYDVLRIGEIEKITKGGKTDDIDYSKQTTDDFTLGEIVYDVDNKRYGTVIGIYDEYGSDKFELRLDSDGMQPTENLRKVGSKGDKGTKEQLNEAITSYARLVKLYGKDNNYPKQIKPDDSKDDDKPKNKWEYTDKDEIEYVVVKDKSKKEIKFDGKDVISGVHDLLEKGGKLTEIGKYYSKNDVVSVFVNGKNILDKNTVSGVWIKKDAKPMAGGGFVVVSENDGYWYIMSKPTSKQVAEEFLSTLTIPRGEVGKVVSVEDAKNHKKVIGRKYLKMADGGDVSEMKIGQTTVRKGFNGWVGKTMVDNFKGYDWDITTIKNSRGDLTTTAQGGKSEDKGGYKMFTFMVYQDPSVRLQTSRPARVNEKVVSEQHAEALKVFKEKVGNTPDKEKMADGGAIGFDALAKKVAKNYEGDKVKKQYQDEYGKTYDKKEAEEVGKKVAGKVYGQQQAKKKMAKGGKVAKKSGSPANRSQSKMTLISRKASEIRKANEPWKDAFNRAKAIIG